MPSGVEHVKTGGCTVGNGPSSKKAVDLLAVQGGLTSCERHRTDAGEENIARSSYSFCDTNRQACYLFW